ncbi:MAG: hypothetical protein U1F34_08500 [Gammaproteobacteria bacterium]
MITSYDQMVETYRGLCREALELSTQYWLGMATLNSAAMKAIDATLARHATAIEEVSSARDIEDLFDHVATLYRDCVGECQQRGMEAVHNLCNEQMQTMQTLYGNSCKMGSLYGRLMRFATAWPQPLVPLWNPAPDAIGRMLRLNPWFQTVSGGRSKSEFESAAENQPMERKVS